MFPGKIIHKESYKVNPSFAGLEDFIKDLPYNYNRMGKTIYKGRNELKEIEYGGVCMVIKSFRIPNFINRIAYGLFRPSKAKRSYEYANLILEKGIGTPLPVGYYTRRRWFLFSESYYACLKSECPNTYKDLIDGKFPGTERIVKAIASLTAHIHKNNMLHKDYSRGNILFKDTPYGVKLEIIDLNRIRFHKIGMEEGCRNFERLPGTDQMTKWMAQEYASKMGYNPDECFAIMNSCKEKV